MIPRKAKKVTLERSDCPRQTLGRRLPVNEQFL